ncbi:hypothetical protein GDO78_023148 [Eleutherodactylus coqui]|uniref:Uncharacterized protein n=1 Tax=Eleutherodactylus coqui TaxID=57060 RepID=A0A8J6BAY6_ELECQ|nr:hypothetical protein GDO78_023148 [Eleutherodactylus coqui]
MIKAQHGRPDSFLPQQDSQLRMLQRCSLMETLLLPDKVESSPKFLHRRSKRQRHHRPHSKSSGPQAVEERRKEEFNNNFGL